MRNFILILFCFGIMSANAQTKQIQAGDKAFGEMQYHKAIEAYENAVQKSDSALSLKIHEKIAKTWLKVNDPQKAMAHLNILINSNYQYPGINLDYANCLRETGNCQKAIEYYQKQILSKTDLDFARAGLESCKLMLSDSMDYAPYIITNTGSLNSAFDDFAPVFADRNFQKLIFASNRPEATGKNIDDWTGQKFSDLFVSNKENDGLWIKPEKADVNNQVNTSANEGVASLDGKFRTLYFTRCENKTNQNIHCAILKASKSGNGWGKSEMVLNGKNDNIGHPAISSNELKIIFASNREGSFGGKDLWMASRKSKRYDFDNFVNLGNVINTEKDELFPVLLNDSTLYFASNGLHGFGGMDIFVSHFTNGNWSKPENILPPFNSSRDDFGITFYGNPFRGFFTSNRDGGQGGDDIYSFVRKNLKTTVKGKFVNEKNKDFIANVKIKLIDKSNSKTFEFVADENGSFTIDTSFFAENSVYEIIATKEDYFVKKQTINTFEMNKDQVLDFEFEMIPILKKPILLPEILYDLNQTEIKPQFKDSLRSLVVIMKDNPRLVIEIVAHTDSRSSNEYNLQLSQTRAEAVVDFIIECGINSARVKAKGYGEDNPRILEKTIVKEGVVFEEGVVLSENYIDGLEEEKAKELAHEMNRRTEFSVISKDFEPILKIEKQEVQIEKVVKSEIKLKMDNGAFCDCYVNGVHAECKIDPDSQQSFIAYDLTTKMLKGKNITVKDFEGDPDEIFANRKIRDKNPINIKKLQIADESFGAIILRYDRELKSQIVLGKDFLDLLGNYELDLENRKLIRYE
jgi:peptidoglycan-associated lipoprotein